MSKVVHKATELFGPGWHGRSHIHVSVCKDITVNHEDPMVVFKAAYKLKLATDIWRKLQHRFKSFEWLLKQAQFEDRAYVDWYQHAKGMGDTQDESKLRNPETGNVFHRVALSEEHNLVAGVRFWCDEASVPGLVEFGWRFRIQALEEESEKVRVRVAEQAVADRIKVEEIEVELNAAPLKETAQTEEVKVKLREIA